MTKSNGFTLIEILVVLLIISIVTSVALLTISRNQNQAVEAFANELTQMVTLAEEQAMLQPNVLGLSVSDTTLQFSSYQLAEGGKKNTWKPLADSVLGKRNIPDDIEIGIETGSLRSAALPEDAAKNNPQIIISTNGDITPFTIYVGIKGEKPRYAITGGADGNVVNKLLS